MYSENYAKEEVNFMSIIKPYSDEEYENAKTQGLDLDDWNDYVEYFGLGEDEEFV